MPHTRLEFGSSAREKVLSGASQLADAVRITLGPKSKSVLIQRAYGEPLVCNDGVTIARRVELADPCENLGARMLRQAAERTGDSVGDGTSTATLLAHAMFAEGLRNVVAGTSAIDIKRGLDRGLGVIVEALHALSRPVATAREKTQVATISAHNDLTIGQLVAEAIERVGDEGAITAEESKGTETTLEVVEGMQFDRGYLSPYFVTDAGKMEAVLENAMILLTAERIASVRELLPVLEEVSKTGRPLLLVAEDVQGEALATLVVNHLRGVLPCMAVKAPGFGDRRKAMLEDIAVLTGAEVVAEERGMKLDATKLDQLGRAERVIADKESTTIVGGNGKRADIEARMQQIRSEIEQSRSDYDRDRLKERLAKLSGGVALIRVGAPTEAEMKSRKDALDDAINATRAAVAEGIVPGGGLAYLRCLEPLKAAEATSGDEDRTGLRILRMALEAPARQIARNSGVDDGVVVNRMLESPGSIGFDAANLEYVDLVESGIIDATKVLRVALENAVSVASVLLLTEATLTEIEETRGEPGVEARETLL
jgi:chaperonin GroEL